MTLLSRRDLCLATGPMLVGASAAASMAPLSRSSVPSAAAIISTLSGLATADLIAGAADSQIKGVAVVPDASLKALERAADAGCSLILSAETPYYGRMPDPAAASGPSAAIAESAAKMLGDSPAMRAKQKLIRDRGLVVYRLTPRTVAGGDTSVEALAARLGWSRYRAAGQWPIYRPPALSLAALVALAQKRLGAEGGLRFIGDPAMRLASILLVPGTSEGVSTTQGLRHADALLTGDVREWELVEYVHDSAEAGLPKALVSTGRILSEQPFLERCSMAVKQGFPSVPLHDFMSADPFWRVQA
jgi:hypothetical protein